MSKRLLDLGLASLGLLLSSPILLCCLFLVWIQDGRSPVYRGHRVGRGGRPFPMLKIRTMLVHADRTGVHSTGANDSRITRVGRILRRWKLDEIPQLLNVIRGDMSLVGPRPNTLQEVALYSPEERRLLEARPGMTDFSSIVFADEAEILRDAEDPDRAYRELIWPWKAALGKIYIARASAAIDLRIILLTAISLFNRRTALVGVQRALADLGASPAIVEFAGRQRKLGAATGTAEGDEAQNCPTRVTR